MENVNPKGFFVAREFLNGKSPLFLTGRFCDFSQICYFIYKNIAFGLTFFYFEAATAFSGQAIYYDWYMILFNVFLTSLPVISLGVFEQDVSSDICLQVGNCSVKNSSRNSRNLTFLGNMRSISVCEHILKEQV